MRSTLPGALLAVTLAVGCTTTTTTDGGGSGGGDTSSPSATSSHATGSSATGVTTSTGSNTTVTTTSSGGTTTSSGAGGDGGSGSTTTTTTTTSSSVSGSTGSGVTTCANAEECGDTTVNVCDPLTDMCAGASCDLMTNLCSASQVCLGQVDMAMVGACYPSCTAFPPSGCTASQFCEPVTAGTPDGACFALGSAAVNANCTQSDVSTGCVTGSVCIDDGGASTVCRKVCDYFGAPAGCGIGLHCDVFDVCSSAVADAAAIDADCAAAASVGDPCAANANALGGACIDTGGANLSCLKWCRLTGTDCPASQTCTAVFPAGYEIGVCF